MLEQLNHYFIISLEYVFYFGLFILVNLYVYDRFIQRRHQLLINYPVIGHCYYSTRVCNDTDAHICPVGLATQDPHRCASYLVVCKSHEIVNYHKNLIKGIRTMLSVIGIAKVSMLSKEILTYKNNNREVFFDIDKYFHHKLQYLG